MDAIKQLAIIGSTASGKTSLSIKLAHKTNAHILSLDSLALYKEIDIVSAKPSMKERGSIRHFGLDMIPPSENFDVSTFIKLYHEVYALCQKEGKNLIIVGGTSFYLKMLIEGISSIPKISQSTQNLCVKHIQNLEETYQWLLSLDPHYMSNIASKDSYRIEKALQLYLETSLIPTEYFRQNPPTPTITAPLPIYQIVWEREQLRKRITQRTQIMLNQGLIDEICMLEKKYTRTPNCMKSIGIKETLAYLDGKYSKKMLLEKISTNTARLAKRQTTFNNGQFKILTKGSLEELEKILLK
jgi:tRNA dimethylallyltransferase